MARLMTGLVSVSFRKLSCPQIVEAAKAAGLESIEWGGDVHVPHGDAAKAKEARALTEAAGLKVASYGSYYRLGKSEAEGLAFGQVLDSAVTLGTKVIRVWAGAKASKDAPAEDRARIIADAQRVAQLAAAAGVTVCSEWHANTLTDTDASATAFLKEVVGSGFRTYWQPPSDSQVAANVTALKQVLPWVEHLHVYHWSSGHERCPLAVGGANWLQYFAVAQADGRGHGALLEFVKGDAVEQLVADAATLRELLAGR